MIRLYVWHGATGWLAFVPSRSVAGSGVTRVDALRDARAELKQSGEIEWGEQLVVMEGPPQENA